MASTDTPPRFFKVFISHFSSDSMLIPISYYDELPRHLPKTAILQGTGGCVWKVAMKQEGEEVYFEQGWPKFVEDNSLVDGDFLTFVYNGDRIFEVSIYGLDGCKQTRAVTEVEDDEEDSICSLSSDGTDTVQRSKNKGKSKVEAVEDSDDEEVSSEDTDRETDTDTDTSSELKMANTNPRSKNKGKSKDEAVKVESDEKEDSDYSLNSGDEETDTGSEFKMANTIQRTKNKGKKQKEVVESCDEDSDYVGEFGRLDLEEDSSSDSSYAPDSDDTATHVKPKETNTKKQGKSKVKVAVDDTDDSSYPVERVKKTREKVKTIIKNPEAYLDDPKNICFETGVKNRKYELLVHAQLVKDYCLRFKEYISYIDPQGKLKAKTAQWKDQRVCIKKWIKICERNKLKKQDRVVCELLRKQDLVYAVKIHIIRGEYL